MTSGSGEFITTGRMDVDPNPNEIDTIVLDILGVQVENENDDVWIISMPVDVMNNLLEMKGIKSFNVNTM